MEYYKQYNGPESVSIVNALAEMGINSSYANRERIAAANGIVGYSGESAQNLRLLSLLKEGKLVKPTESVEPTTDTTNTAANGNVRKFIVGSLIVAGAVALGKLFFGNEPKTATKKSGKKKGKKSLKGVDDKNYEVQVRFPGSDGWESICTCHNKKDAQAEIEHQRHIEDDGDCEYRIVNNRKGLNGTEKTKYRVGDIVEANFTNQLGKFQYPCIIIKKRKMFGEQYYEVHEIAMNKYPFEVGDKNGAFVVDWRIDTLREVSLRPITNDKKADIRKLLKKK